MPTLTNIYSDIDLTFQNQPVTGDVSISYDANAVIRSVRGLLLTNFYERLWQPDVGSNVDLLLFEPISPLSASQLQNEITQCIQNYEPRAQIQSVIVTPYEDQNAFTVSLVFFIGNNTSPTTVNMFLERSR